MANIAEISVIATASVGTLVGLGGPGITAYFAAKREERASKDARLDELRSVLDDAAKALMA